MALYNEIQIGRINRFLQKYLGIKGGPPSPQLQADIGVSLVLSNDQENRYLEGWDRFAALSVVPAAGAGNASFFRIRNPAGSNAIAMVEFLLCSPATSAQTDLFAIQGGAATTDLGNLLGNSAGQLDSRGRLRSVLIISTNAAGLAGTALPLTFVQSGFLTAGQGYQFILTEDMELPILPGTAIGITNNTLNQASNVSIITRERFLEEGERF